MGLFRKKRDPEQNEIHNEKLKQQLVNCAVQLLVQNGQMGVQEPVSTEFGYLFDIEGHGLEGLFKVQTGQQTFYFAAQKEKLLRVGIDEEMFCGVTQTFLLQHPQPPV